MPAQLTDSIIKENLRVATEYFKATVADLEKNPKSGGATGFIPFKINFTTDGLSGIKIYNELKVDTSFLPTGYTKTTKFIITGVEHKISNGDWETSINTTLIPNPSAIDIITADIVISPRESYITLPPVNNDPNGTSPNEEGNTSDNANPTPSDERDLWVILTIIIREAGSSNPVGMADVAQSLSNRVQRAIEDNIADEKTYYGVVTKQCQYQPAFSSGCNGGKGGYAANEWLNITDFKTAKIALNYDYSEPKKIKYPKLSDADLGGLLKKAYNVMIDPVQREESRKLVEGRTSFKASSEFGLGPNPAGKTSAQKKAVTDAADTFAKKKTEFKPYPGKTRTNNVWRGPGYNVMGWQYSAIKNIIGTLPSIETFKTLEKYFN